MRPIDADKLLQDIKEYHLSDGMFQHWVEVQPTIIIDSAPFIHSEWIWDPDGIDWGIGAWKCKNCKQLPNSYWQENKIIKPSEYVGSRYCPNCGAKMSN